MADNVQSVMLEILKRLQSDMSDVKARVAGLERLQSDMSDVKARLDRLEDIGIKQRRDSAAMLVMMRGSVGIFDERVTKLETDVQAIKDRG
jgi:Tfp pilus assembly protein PilN